MKKFLIIAVSALALAACSKVPAGNVGVKVYLLGSSKGVDSEELGPGRYWIGINEDLFLFPTFTQNYVWTAGNDPGSEGDESISFQTTEGLTVNADVGISYHVDPTKVNVLFQRFRKGIDEITDLYVRNMVRDSLVKIASRKRIESVYGEGKSDLIEAVQAEVARQIEPYGIVVEKVYLIGEMRLPSVVVQALNAKIEATQRAQQRENEIQQTKAEAQKAIEEARGVAESARLRAEAEAKARLLVAEAEAKAIEIQGAALAKHPNVLQLREVEKWDGAYPRVLLGEKSATSLLIDGRAE